MNSFLIHPRIFAGVNSETYWSSPISCALLDRFELDTKFEHFRLRKPSSLFGYWQYRDEETRNFKSASPRNSNLKTVWVPNWRQQLGVEKKNPIKIMEWKYILFLTFRSPLFPVPKLMLLLLPVNAAEFSFFHLIHTTIGTFLISKKGTGTWTL